MTKAAALFAALLFFTAGPLLAESFTGKVVGVTDGDTLTVLRGGKERVRVVLHGIDCPEPGQPYADKAEKMTAELASGKEVRVEVRDTDRYRRTVANIFLPDGKLLNQELTRAGLAWWSDKYAPEDKTLQELQSAAKKARRGLWADEKPTPPWQYRRIQREKEAAAEKDSRTPGEGAGEKVKP